MRHYIQAEIIYLLAKYTPTIYEKELCEMNRISPKNTPVHVRKFDS